MIISDKLAQLPLNTKVVAYRGMASFSPLWRCYYYYYYYYDCNYLYYYYDCDLY